MKYRLSEERQAMLLGRRADQPRPNHARLAALPPRPVSRAMRVAGETLGGLFFGVPLGLWLYYVILSVYCPVMLLLGLAEGAITAVFPIPAASNAAFGRAVDFGSWTDIALAASALAAGVFLTRLAIRRGYSVFAWVQLPLMAAAVLALFTLTLVYQKPLLPFYGQ